MAPTDDPDDLPIAQPVEPPPAGPPADRPRVVGKPVGKPVARAAPTTPPAGKTAARTPPEAPPKPRVLSACCVVGCLGFAVVGSLGFLAAVAVVVLGQLGNRLGDIGSDGGMPTELTARGPRPEPVTKTKRPFAANKPVTLDLDAPFDAVGRGAGGRYLFLRLNSDKGTKLAVFDPVEGAIVHTLPLDDPRILFAAGAGKLFVYKPGPSIVERYDLLTWAKESTAPALKRGLDVKSLVVGPGAEGPVFLVATGNDGLDVAAFDPDSLAQITLYHHPGPWPAGQNLHARASHDGKLLGLTAGGREGTGLLLRYEGGLRAVPLTKGDPPGHLSPAPDGRSVYTGRGFLDPLRPARPAGEKLYAFPTAHGGDLFLSLGVNETTVRGPLRLHLAGDAVPAVDPLDELTTIAAQDADDGVAVPIDQRVHLWPAAGLLAVLPSRNVRNDRLVLTPIDVAGRLEKSGKDYLVFGSDPPTWVARGQRWQYRATVWSGNRDKTELTVVKGPPGMKADGLVVSWTAPRNPPEAEVEVHLRATDGDLTADQKFRLVIVE